MHKIDKIVKNCTTCEHESHVEVCSKYCIDFKNHEFKCHYCINKLDAGSKFCACENDDGSQNCCGDHFEFNYLKFKL